MKTEESQEFIELLIKAVDGCLWSEGCYFGLEKDEIIRLDKLIREYNKGAMLDLFCFDSDDDMI